jgi:hypothetical protein
LFTEACQIDVFVGSKDISGTGNPYDEPTTTPRKALAAAVTGGSFVITKIEVRFDVNGWFIPTWPHPLPSLLSVLPPGFGWHLPVDRSTGATLTANAPLMMFETGALDPEAIRGAVPVVRWTDRSGQRWQYGNRRPDRITGHPGQLFEALPAAASDESQ